jgi:two-component system sensor histidine kinase AgrC
MLLVLFLVYFVLYVRFYIIAHIILGERSIKSVDLLYISVTGVALAVFRANAIALRITVGMPPTDSSIIVFIFIVPIVLFYFYALKRRPVRQAISMTLLTTVLITASFDNLLHFLGVAYWHNHDIILSSFQSFALFIAIHLIPPILLAFLLVLITRKCRVTLSKPTVLHNVIIVLSVIAIIFTFFFRAWDRGTGFRHAIDSIVFVNALTILPLVVAGFIYSRLIKQRHASEQEHDEMQNLRYYMKALEQQYDSTQKFKHDYQNILASINIFIIEENWEALKQYYNNEILFASQSIIKDHFLLEALRKIKVAEIRGLISTKILAARSISPDIEVTFEAPDNIDDIFIRPIALIRMLGIILDNAIDELTVLKKGKLATACFMDKKNLTIVVENTCRTDIPNLQTLKKSGFSTKDDHQGVGLSILDEIQISHPNIMLSTIVENNTFTQKITISKNNRWGGS